MDALTGKTIWTFDYPTSYRDDFGFDEGPRAVPVIAGGRVFTHGADGMLHGIDFATGQEAVVASTRARCSRRRRATSASPPRRWSTATA